MLKKVFCLLLLAIGSLPVNLRGDSIVAYWNFNNDFKATLGGEPYDATAVNGATIAPTAGKFGGAAQFTKSLSQYVTAASPFTTGSYTYSAWYYLNVTNINSTDRYFVLEATDTPKSTYPQSFGLRDLSGVDSGQIYTQSPTDLNIAFADAPHKAWQNVIVTYDAATQTTKAYLNGQLKGQVKDTVAGTLKSSNILVIGSHRAGSGRNWEGYIDEVAVWDYVLSPAEIAAVQTTPVPEPSTGVLLLSLLGGFFLLRGKGRG